MSNIAPERLRSTFSELAIAPVLAVPRLTSSNLPPLTVVAPVYSFIPISIWVPPDKPRIGDRGHRLVSFSPGVIIGEMGLLENRPRSADALAEDDVELLELPRAAYDRLASERPDILGRIFLNLSIHQSTRMRALTDELTAALALR